MVLAFSAFLKRHVTAKKRADEAEKKALEGVEEEAAMGRYQKIRFLSNGPCVFVVFKDAVTRSGASGPENVPKPQCLYPKDGPPKGGNNHRWDCEAPNLLAPGPPLSI